MYGKLYIAYAKVALERANVSSSDKIGRIHYKHGNVSLLLAFFLNDSLFANINVKSIIF